MKQLSREFTTGVNLSQLLTSTEDSALAKPVRNVKCDNENTFSLKGTKIYAPDYCCSFVTILDEYDSYYDVFFACSI